MKPLNGVKALSVVLAVLIIATATIILTVALTFWVV